MKALFTMTLMTLISLTAFAQTKKVDLPTQPGEPRIVNGIDPAITELPVANKEVLKGNKWGKITMTSKPIVKGEDNIEKIQVSLNVECKGTKKAKVLLKATDICGYQRAEFEKKMFDENPLINSWTYDPELNVTATADGIQVLVKENGTEKDKCGAAKTITVPVDCK